MAMNASKLDRRAQFRRAVLVDNGYSTVEQWQDRGHPVYAARRDISDAEKFASGTVLSVLTSRFTVRHSPFTADLTPSDRLTCDGAEWAITGIKEVSEPRRCWLEITATRLADV